VINDINLIKQDLKDLFLKLPRTKFKKYSLISFSILFATLFLLESREYVRNQKLLSGIITLIVEQPFPEGEIGLVKNTLAVVKNLSQPNTDFIHGEKENSDHNLEVFFSGSGDYGRHSHFACRVLTEMGYSCRLVQQQVNGTWGGHITLEVDLNRFNKSQPARWMLVDPLFNHMFLDTQQRELSADAVKTLWPKNAEHAPGEYDISQLPVDYPEKYNYQQGFRYTNWDKYGLLTRTIYRVGKFFQLPMDTFSYRAVFIKQHFWNIAIYAFGLLLTMILRLRTRIKISFSA
jgi:hypothetical protein